MIETGLLPGDVAPLVALVEATGFFQPAEVAIARELMEQHLDQGAERSGYFFTRIRGQDGALTGFTCYGPIPGTEGSFDLYWIVVAPSVQRQHWGQRLLQNVIDDIERHSARLLYAETSSQPLYAPTRQFYLHNGFEEVARLPGFYRPGDDKVIYARPLAPRIRTRWDER